jgi:uncharacterized Fe-S cluster-containing MiaB family protein
LTPYQGFVLGTTTALDGSIEVRNVEIGLETLKKKIKDLCINDQSCHGNAFIRLTKTFPRHIAIHI